MSPGETGGKPQVLPSSKSGGLMEYFLAHGPKEVVVFEDGAILNPGHFPVGAIETDGAILFADLPSFSRTSTRLNAVEAAYYVSHFFAWVEGSVGARYGGIVDKFIGDAVMMVFPASACKIDPIEAALKTARDILEQDSFGFDPKFGIAGGPFVVALVGTQKQYFASAMGHTVNLAARCVQATVAEKSVTTTAPQEVVSAVFGGRAWDVRAPRKVEPKNMSPIQVVDAVRKTFRTLNFNYEDSVREGVAFAQSKGAVVDERKPK